MIDRCKEMLEQQLSPKPSKEQSAADAAAEPMASASPPSPDNATGGFSPDGAPLSPVLEDPDSAADAARTVAAESLAKRPRKLGKGLTLQDPDACGSRDSSPLSFSGTPALSTLGDTTMDLDPTRSLPTPAPRPSGCLRSARTPRTASCAHRRTAAPLAVAAAP